MNNKHFNPSFKLNGKSFDSADAIINFSKEISFSMHQFLMDWFSSEEFIEMQTSGSTGKPKLISIKKEFMKNSAEMTGTFFNVKDNNSALLCLPTDYIAGRMMLVRALVLGWQLDVILPTSKPLKNTKKKYDFAAFVPLQLTNSLAKINQIKKLIIGGGKVSQALVSKIQHIKTTVFATYGMTETVTHIAVAKLNVNSKNKANELVYEILPDISIAIDDRNCLVIDAPKLSAFRVITNDIVALISKNQFKILGRFDNVINSGGLKLHPEIIEEKLSKIINKRFFVIGVPDQHLGEKLVLIIEGNNDNIVLKNASLSKFETPKMIFFVSKFVETKTGKIQRKKTLNSLGLKT